MDDKTKTIAAVVILMSILIIVMVIIGIVVSGKKVVSPIPESGAIKIIFITPTQPVFASPTPATTSAAPTGKSNR